ncbi:glycosyltransferase family 4 protein [Microbispora sp. ATCC PTA-5024]|uniref:glycosyltransferase family 4 protein n=1 Tax=Microbispora sp. ATCC PTA-5024 TaxID=316330 RepID=UPI0003DC8C72|nr:glycosyltransferase family 4 protein [Microbispora sp. ATCC PTA-5024]ETK33480.1 hypothetical protein MPTA5024_24285 [Microbispora sp. ATCC PTA-5024]
MRILRVSYRVPPEPGGKERHVECLTREQLGRGHEVTLAFRKGTAVPAGADALALRPTPLSPLLAVKSDVLAFAAEVSRTLRRLRRPDLVHLHGDHVEAAVLGPACRRLGIPLVLTVHAALSRRHTRFARRSLRGLHGYIAIGSGTARDLVRLGSDPTRIRVASSGLDLRELDRHAGPPERERGLVVADRAAYRTFRSGSTSALAAALAAVLDDEEARRRMSDLGRRAAADLGWPAVADGVEETYRRALQAAGSRR